MATRFDDIRVSRFGCCRLCLAVDFHNQGSDAFLGWCNCPGDWLHWRRRRRFTALGRKRSNLGKLPGDRSASSFCRPRHFLGGNWEPLGGLLNFGGLLKLRCGTLRSSFADLLGLRSGRTRWLIAGRPGNSLEISRRGGLFGTRRTLTAFE